MTTSNGLEDTASHPQSIGFSGCSPFKKGAVRFDDARVQA